MHSNDDGGSRLMILSIIGVAFLAIVGWVSNDVDRRSAMAPDIAMSAR